MPGGGVGVWGIATGRGRKVGGGRYELLRIEGVLWIHQHLWDLAVWGGSVSGVSDGCGANRSEPVGAGDGKDGGGGNVYAGGTGGV